MISHIFLQNNSNTLEILNAAAASSPINQLLLQQQQQLQLADTSPNGGSGSSPNGGDTVSGLRAQLRLKDVSVNMMKREVEKYKSEATELRADNEKLRSIVQSVDGMDVEDILRRDQAVHEVRKLCFLIIRL